MRNCGARPTTSKTSKRLPPSCASLTARVANANRANGTALYAWRNIVEMPDGALLATIEGNFHSDRVAPVGARNRAEIHSEEPYKLRTSVVRSTDDGESWDYISTVARPSEDDDAVGEGYAEPSFALLDNGDLFCIMRSGNYTPLYSARSTDGGNSWEGPVYTGLERGLDPCLLKLADGRLLCCYGMRYPRPARQEVQVIRARVQACSNSPSAKTAAAATGSRPPSARGSAPPTRPSTRSSQI